ncbi:MAG: hypothetical protein Q7U10_08900 [Thermodesulfovibrionia bacterium]|nr:hypothetical protein [Thermodesulfovibrionia bacterium]
MSNNISQIINRFEGLLQELHEVEDPQNAADRQVEKLTKTVTDPRVLASMKWLTMKEAIIYSRKSKNTLLKYIMKNLIYGDQVEGGDWIVDRESIDRFYNTRNADRNAQKLIYLHHGTDQRRTG